MEIGLVILSWKCDLALLGCNLWASPAPQALSKLNAFPVESLPALLWSRTETICIGSQQEFRLKKKKKKRKGCAEVAVSMYFTRRFAFSSERDQWLCEIGESCREVTVVDCSLAELLHLLWNLEQPQHKMQLSILNMLWEWKEKLYCKQAVNKEKNYLFNLNEEPGSHPDTINSTYLKDNIMLFLDIPVRWVFCEVKRVGGLLTLRRLQN